jgi:GTPase
VIRGADSGGAGRVPLAKLEEAVGLARAIGLEAVHADLVRLDAPRPATLLGEGKVAEIHDLCEALEPSVVYVDGALTPVQQRNLEKAWGAKVIDRTGLILEIFGARARTKEGRLQVELAHLTYQKSRLVRSWTHLERQRGGFGFLGGPGESQIETDRRLIGERIAKIRKELTGSVRTRTLHRSARKKVPYPVVALVGYTNAGKSTLFNTVTRAEVLAADMLFATLDPSMRAAKLPGGRRVILSDTVGFISDLPTQLIAAFRATLEEVLEADLILHVRDVSHADTRAQAEDVTQVLESLGLAEDRLETIQEVWNKLDTLPEDEKAKAQAQAKRAGAIAISALTGEGVPDLLAIIEARLSSGESELTVEIAPGDGAGLAWAYTHASVRKRKVKADGTVALTLSVPEARLENFRERFPAVKRPKQRARAG